MRLQMGVKYQASHKVHEQFSKTQQGGTCMIANEEVA